MGEQKFTTFDDDDVDRSALATADSEHDRESTSKKVQFCKQLTLVLPMLAVGVSAFFFSLQQLYAKLVQGRIPAFQLLFVRSIVQCMIAIVLIRKQNGELSLPGVFGDRAVMHWLVLRGFVGFGGLGGAMWSSQLLPLADAQTLVWTSPIFTVFIACIFLGEKATKVEIAALCVSLSGAILVTKPSFLFNGPGGPEPLPVKGVFIALVASFSIGAVVPIVRHLGDLKVPAIINIHWQALAGVILALPCLFAAGQQDAVALPHGPLEWIVIITIGPVGFVAQSLMTWGMTRERAGPASTMRLWDVVFSFIWQGAFVAEEPLHALDFLGGALVFLGTMLSMCYKFHTKRASQTAKPTPLPEEQSIPLPFGLELDLAEESACAGGIGLRQTGI